MPFVISKDPIEGDFDSDTESKFVIGGEVTPEGSPIYDEDDILTKAGWRYRKKTTDTDMVKGAAEAVKGLWNGFAKIPDVVRAKGFTGASGNLPEAMLAAGEGWKDIVKSVASKNYAVVTGMSEEQDLDRQYDNYREVAERSVAQVKRSRSRVGDFFRAIGAPEHAATMDESIDQDVANSLSMVLDPTNLIGGGSLKALLAAGKGGKVAVAGEKAAVAGEKALQAVEKVSAEVAETTAKVVPPIRDGPPTFNWVETPGAAATSAVGKGAENVGKFGTSVGEKLADWQKANPLAAPIASAALAGYGSDWDPLAIIGGAVAPSAIKASATKLKLAGEAAQVAAIASREGLDVAAKSGIAGEKVSDIAKRLDTPAVNFLLSQSAQLADAVVRGAVIGGGLGYATGNDPEVSAVGSGIGAGIVGGTMGRLQSIGIDQTGRVAFHRPDADGKWVRVSESPAALARDQDLAVSFLASRSLPERTVLAGRLNIAELAELARGEAAAKGASRATGSDMEVRFLDADGMVAAGFDPTVAKVMQGVTETDQKPTLYVNLDVATDPAYTLWHEGMHGFDRLAPDEKGGKQTDAGAALEQTRAELKAFYFGSYDASGKQTSPGKYDGAQFLKLEDQYLSRVGMSEAEMTAHMGQPMSKRVAYIADEMAAEAAGMLGRLSGGDIGKASRYPSTALGRAALGVLARTRIGLESLGIVFDGGGDVVTSGIFKDPTTGKRLELSSDVREKLAAYLRAKDKITTRMSIDFDESPITEVVNARDLAKASTTPETLARWKNSGMFALDDKGEIRMMGGKPVFLTAAERKKVDANRSLAIFTAIKNVPDDGSPGLRSEVIDGVETFKGTKLSKAQVDAVLALPDAVLPPSVKDRISELVKLQEVPGGPVFADYNKAITGGRYDSKASISTQIFVPMSLSISAAGNFLVSSFSVVGYERKVAMWKKTKKKFFEPWDGNMDSFHNDVRTYLENQESGAGNVAVGKEAITKKNAIHDFLASVLVGDMNRVSTKSNSDNLIRSFRVDRMQSIERAGGNNMPYDYGKVRANFMPADDEAVMGGQARSQPADELSPAKLASLQSAKRYHGITRNISEAGYALPDGSLLDFSGRHQMQDSYEMRGGSWVPKAGKKDWQAGSRNVDHREIQFDGPQPDATSGGDMMVAYQKLGAMRVDATSSLVDMEVRPTSAQESVIRRIAEQNGGNITVDLQDGNRKSGLFYEGAKPQKVLGDIRRFYSGEDLKSGARFQPSDTDYLAAVKSGDMKVVQGMVDAAAKGKGPFYHRSGAKEIEEFYPWTNFGTEEQAATVDLTGRSDGTSRTYKVYLDISNPLRVEDQGMAASNVMAQAMEQGVVSSKEYSAFPFNGDDDIERAYVIKMLRSKGYDGLVYLNEWEGEGDSFITFTPSQIKSADPITRDAQGNVIPLSKRFNTTSEDIRYQPAEENAKYSKPPREADAEEALYKSKRPFWGIHRGIDEGTPVGVRIDIPAYTKNGVYVQTVHESATPGNVGARIGYDNAVRLSGPVRFFVKEGSEDINSGALAIKEGRADKHPIATVEGDYIRDRSAPSDINSWTAVGMNPDKHSYFYDKLTGEPVVGGSESYSVGNTVFVKDPVYGSKSDYRYQPADGADVVRLADPEDSTAFANVPALKKNGKPALDPAGKPKTKKIAYGLLTGMEKHSGVAVDPSHPDYKSLAYDVPVVAQQLINAAIDNGGVDKLAGELVAKTRESLKNPEIAGGMGWYSRMRGHLLRALDEEGREIFSQLLGATSAKTPVEQNFLQAVDAHEGMRSGRYEGVKAKHLEMMDAERAGTLNALIEERGYVKKIGEMERAMSKELRFLKGADRDRVKLDIKSIKRLLNLAPDEREKAHRIAIMKFAEDIVPRRSNGRKFNSNSGAVLKVLIGTWIQNREAPKTPNFAGNLSGRTIAATIDVWAARHLRELIHGNTDGPWRIQPKSEGAVSNADFALGQVIMERAAKQLGMNPDDLQAVLWFAEKDHWDKQGWTSKDGASKSSFDDVFHIFFPEGKDPLTFAEGERKVKELRERLKLSEAEELIDAESDSD